MYILSYLILYFQTVTSQCNIYCFTHIVMCIQVKQINLKQYERAVDCRKGKGLTGIKWLEKSGIHTSPERCLISVALRVGSKSLYTDEPFTLRLITLSILHFQNRLLCRMLALHEQFRTPCFTAWHLVRTVRLTGIHTSRNFRLKDFPIQIMQRVQLQFSHCLTNRKMLGLKVTSVWELHATKPTVGRWLTSGHHLSAQFLWCLFHTAVPGQWTLTSWACWIHVEQSVTKIVLIGCST